MKKTTLLLLFLPLIFFIQSCSSDKTVSVSKKETVENPSQIQTQQLRRSNTVTEPVDASQPTRRFSVVFNGHLSVSEQRLYTLSSRAELGVAQALGKNQSQFVEMTSANTPQSLFVLSEENSEKSVGQLDTTTNFFYTLASHVGSAFDLKSQSPSKLGFLKKEKDRRLSLNILFTEDKEIKNKIFDQNEAISYAFARESDALVYTKMGATKSSVFKMSIEKENFGKQTLLFEKEGVEISEPVMDSEDNQICFIEKTVKTSQATCLNLTTREETILLERDTIYEPALSPDDQYLVFWSEAREGQKLWLYDFSSSRLQEIATLSVPSKDENSYRVNRVHPTWTQDSREVIFGNFNKWYGHIEKYGVFTKKNQVLTDNIFVDFYNPVVLGEENL